MGKRIAEVVDIDGIVRETPDFPMAVLRRKPDGDNSLEGDVVDPVFTHHVSRNLYGRIMTLLEATTDANKLKAVKDVFSKELLAWENDVYRSARQVALEKESPDPNNIYTR